MDCFLLHSKICYILNKYNIPVDILNKYHEKHRYYHNYDHILYMVNDANNKNIISDDLLLAIIFHDIIYDPFKTDNEEKSVEFFMNYSDNQNVINAILDTKNIYQILNYLNNYVNSIYQLYIKILIHL